MHLVIIAKSCWYLRDGGVRIRLEVYADAVTLESVVERLGQVARL